MLRKLFGGGPKVVVVDNDREIDLLPFAKKVLKHAPAPCGMDAERLAILAKKSYFGRRLKVSEFPADIDRDYAKIVIGRVISWSRWRRTIDGARRAAGLHYFWVAGNDACKAMLKLHGKPANFAKAGPLPRPDCWKHCHCRLGCKVKWPHKS